MFNPQNSNEDTEDTEVSKERETLNKIRELYPNGKKRSNTTNTNKPVMKPAAKKKNEVG